MPSSLSVVPGTHLRKLHLGAGIVRVQNLWDLSPYVNCKWKSVILLQSICCSGTEEIPYIITSTLQKRITCTTSFF